ncbi:MAG TPA: hypothetical protein VGD60_07195 [Candidatus Acidoferrales bacterium]
MLKPRPQNTLNGKGCPAEAGRYVEAGGGVTNPGTPTGVSSVLITFNGTAATPVPTVTLSVMVK